MRFTQPLIAGRFVARPNRFLCLVTLEGDETPQPVHLPDPGRLRELLRPGAPVFVERKTGAHRKTRYQLRLACHDGVLVSLDTRVPNLLVAEALAAGALAPLRRFTSLLSEVVCGESRLDFLLTRPGERCWLEVKSVTLVVNRRGLFPDAVTLRGRRHLAVLIGRREAGDRAVVLFVVQRPDAEAVTPHEETDPRFAQALRAAQAAGVELLATTCAVHPDGVSLKEPIPVRLRPPW